LNAVLLMINRRTFIAEGHCNKSGQCNGKKRLSLLQTGSFPSSPFFLKKDANLKVLENSRLVP
jgi:hypothetical protein